MEKNQFFYSIEIPAKEGEEKQVAMASFNPDYVIRTVEQEPGNGKLVIMLDDFHEQNMHERTVNKNGKVLTKPVKATVCSEILLNEEDSKRYKETFEV